MTRIKQISTITNLKYALKELQCNKCGCPLKWKTNFSDVNQPRYLSTHCNQDFVISIATVRVETQKVYKIKDKFENAMVVKDSKEQDPRTTKKVSTVPHDKNVELATIKRDQAPGKHSGSNRNEDYNKYKKDTRHYDRELILPSDSNVVKGNV